MADVLKDCMDVIIVIIAISGPLTSTDSVSLIAFLNGPKHSKEDLPDFQLYFAETPTKLVQKKFGLTDEVI